MTDYDDDELEAAMHREVSDDTPTKSDLQADAELNRRAELERLYQAWCNEHHLDPDDLSTILDYENFHNQQQQEDEQ